MAAAGLTAPGPTAPVIMWFRRDLRLADNPALLAASDESMASGGGRVVPVFVLDPALYRVAGAARRAYLASSLRVLDQSMGGSLAVLHGDPVSVIPQLARMVGARSVHAADDHGPYGRRRDSAVKAALHTVPARLLIAGTGYAAAPGSIRKPDGQPYRVFAPYYQRWLDQVEPASGAAIDRIAWLRLSDDEIDLSPLADIEVPASLPAAGERAAQLRWARFLANDVAGYAAGRDIPGADHTSKISVHLKWGELHPTTLLSDLARLGPNGSDSISAFRRQLAFRDFCADLLAQRPDLARASLNPRWDRLELDSGPDADLRLERWKHGMTGYPMVDAGMRQLQGTGWMHNRVRMLTASFLVKDLHLDWRVGARWFMRQLVDGDLASNSQGWQWVAGAGTDAAPYFRVFNPVVQGLRFDPRGDYVRRWIPELSHLPAGRAHEPWREPNGHDRGYPHRIVDHQEERATALARWADTRPEPADSDRSVAGPRRSRQLDS